MEKRLSYTIVGIFVLVITISLFGFLFWLGKYGNKSVEHDYYNTYFSESVSGLNVESLVKLHGVEVGRVKKIAINKANSEEVKISLEIIKGTPIKEDSYCVLDSQGITGLKYIELKGGLKGSKLLTTSKDNIATIASRKSVLSTLLDSGGSITAKVENILDRVNILLDEKNIENINNTLSRLSSSMQYIDENKEKIGELSSKIDEFLEHTKEFEDKMMPSVTKLGEMSDKAGEASDETKEFFAGMNKELKNGEFSVGTIVESNLQILNETAHSLKSLSQKLEETVDSLKDSPSDLLYKSNKPTLGPGESHD
ncbi:MAG: MlaD family protein [Campylobacterota bacterium]|nr:MlaD family protein [Campylobacterota bacterium]